MRRMTDVGEFRPRGTSPLDVCFRAQSRRSDGTPAPGIKLPSYEERGNHLGTDLQPAHSHLG